ncbi:hypothetical protein [Sphingomonas bacterium]|uniref:hypothetical protein n=1 Tax=Sphingomonas bacterium TaxID=1895847 RepID=UPI0015767BBC|nr:hypothetical protein [Sphingomonas bacterium]
MRHLLAMVTVGLAGPALAGPAVTVTLPTAAATRAQDFRLPTVIAPANHRFRLDDPQSMLATGFGNTMVNLFPFAGGSFHFGAGPRLFGRTGRPHLTTPEAQLLLPAFRVPGMRMSRRMTPALMFGFGKPVEEGLSFGIDAGFMKGKMTQGPDRIGRINHARIDGDLRRGRGPEMNQLLRMTALYRF